MIAMPKDSIVIGKNVFFFLYNDELYVLNGKEASVNKHP
jgi:hypothetical protein